MKAFVTMFNRLSKGKPLIENLADSGLEVIILDGGSTYPPLLEWYKKCPFKIHTVPTNQICWAYFNTELWDLYTDQYFISSDCDLDISNVPKDFIDHLMNGLVNTPEVWKSSLSLEIFDLPDTPFAREIYDHEIRYWTNKNPWGFHVVDVDNSLVICDRNRRGKVPWMAGRRADKPYTARHYDWYLTDETYTNEDDYYVQRTQWYGWVNLLKEKF